MRLARVGFESQAHKAKIVLLLKFSSVTVMVPFCVINTNCSPLNDWELFLVLLLQHRLKTRTRAKCWKILETVITNEPPTLTLRMGTPPTFLPINFILCFNFWITNIYLFARQVHHSTGYISCDPGFVGVWEIHMFFFNVNVWIFSVFLQLIQQATILSQANDYQYWP